MLLVFRPCGIRNCTCLNTSLHPSPSCNGLATPARKYFFHRTHKTKGGNRHIECDEDVTIVCLSEIGCLVDRRSKGLRLGRRMRASRGDYIEVVVDGVITSKICTNQSMLRDAMRNRLSVSPRISRAQDLIDTVSVKNLTVSLLIAP